MNLRSPTLGLLAAVSLPALAVAQQVPAIQTTAQATAQVHPVSLKSDVPTTTVTAPQQTVPRTMPPPINPVSPDKSLNAKQRAGVAAARRWINRYQKPRLDDDGVVHFTYGRGQVSVVCSVLHICDIALQPGEVVSPPLHIGDPKMWIVHPAISGHGATRTTHLIIKPTDAGLDTNMVVETNRRTYSIQLVSHSKDYMPLVAFDYPEDETRDAWAAYPAMAGAGSMGSSDSPCDQVPAIPPSGFEISGKASWRPTQVYAVTTPVGMKTCVEFPSDIGSQTLPALLALGSDGGWFSEPSKQIVNVRYVGRKFVVDELLNKFELVDGVGDDQKAVKITRKGS